MKFIAAVLALTTFSAFAATTGTLLLKGKVDEKIAIVVTPAPIATTLPLDISQTNTLVGTVEEMSNSATGYKVSVSSANGGALIRNGGTESFGYALTYDDVAVTLSSPSDITTVSDAGSYDATKNVKITYTGVPADQMVAGTYTDTLTFSISAN